ncbi:hypothetical protein BGZ68_010191 [Mortierella alpina]|nr:hypothetical protein BGZ68_010191 [Mortierella alpina]
MAGQKASLKNDHGISSSLQGAAHSITQRNTSAASDKADSKIQQQEEGADDEEEEFDVEDDNEDSENSLDASDSSDIDDIPDPEKWRIIKESGIMEQVKAGDESRRLGNKRRHRRHDDDKDRDYVFEGIFFSIPTTCLFVVMDILVHRQFGEEYGTSDIFHKVIKVFPVILFMVYFSNKSKNSQFTQAVMFVTSVLCGCYFLHTMFRSPAMGIMLRAPGIITILVYCIVQLNLLPAFISLALCGLYYKFGNVKYN